MKARATPWPPGVPCWADLNVPDIEDSLAFYKAVLGWSFGPPNKDFNDYTIANVDGFDVAGIGPQEIGSRSVWTLYFASDDAAATEGEITRCGGRVLLPASDAGDIGRLLIALDPSGAAFGVWEAGDHVGSAVLNRPGAITWTDLRTKEPDTARAFYSELFDFAHTPLDGAPPEYQTFSTPGSDVPLGGIGGMFKLVGLPAHWLVYFGVTDVDAAISAAEENRGSVIIGEIDTPYGRMAGLEDPHGAMFWVVETDGANQPDRSS